MRVCIWRVVFQLKVSEENGEGEDGEDREDERMWGCEDVRMKRRGCMTHNTGFTPIYIVNKFNFKPLRIKRQVRSKVSATYNFNNTKNFVILWQQKLCNIIYIFNFRNWDKKCQYMGGGKADFPPSLPRILSYKIEGGIHSDYWIIYFLPNAIK